MDVMTQDELDKVIAAYEELRRNAGDWNALTQEQIRLMRQATSDERESLDILNKRLEVYRELATTAADHREISELETKAVREKLDTSRKHLTVLLQRAATQTVLSQGESAALAAAKDAVEKAEEEYEQKKLANEEMRRYTATLEESVSIAKDLGAELGKAFAAPGSVDLMGKLSKLSKIFQGGETSIAAFDAALTRVAATQFINNMAGMVIAIVDMEADFRRITGANEEFARSVTESFEQTKEFGVTAEIASKATQDLYNSYTDFTFLAKETRAEMEKTSAILNKLGVATDDFAKGTQAATKMFGVHVDQVAELHQEIFTFAEDIGVAPQKMAAEFAAAGPQLAKFGEQGVKAFKDLERTAKITGMEMNKILNLTNKFDTFESAAEMTGKLNAALGGNFVNAMDMMMETDPAARFETIRESILDAGLSFDTMSYYQKQFYTESLGLADVGDLALMLSGNMETLDGVTQKTSKDYEVLAEQALKNQKIQDKWKAALADMTPILMVFIDALSAVANNFKAITIVMAPLLAVYIKYKALMIAFLVIEKTQLLMLGLLSQGTISFGFANMVLAATSKLAYGMVGLLAAGLIYLAYALMMSSPSLLVAAIVALGVALLALGRASDASVISIQALAIPMLQLGAALALSTLGLAAMAAAFSLMDVSQMVGMGIALGILVAAIVAMGIFGVAAAPGIAAVGVAMLPLGAALLMIGASVALVAAGIGLMGIGFSAMSKAFETLELSKMIAFGAMMAVIAGSALFLPVAGASMVVLGAGILMIGAGIGIAAAGIGALAAGLSLMFEVMDPIKMLAFGMMMTLIAATAFLLPAAGAGMTALGTGMLVVAASLTLMGPALMLFTELTNSMILLANSAGGLAIVASEFRNIADAVDDIPYARTVVLTKLTKEMGNLSVASAAAGPAAIQRVTDMFGIIVGEPAGTPAARGGGMPKNITIKGTLKLNEEATTNLLKGRSAEALGTMIPEILQ